MRRIRYGMYSIITIYSLPHFRGKGQGMGAALRIGQDRHPSRHGQDRHLGSHRLGSQDLLARCDCSACHLHDML